MRFNSLSDMPDKLRRQVMAKLEAEQPKARTKPVKAKQPISEASMLMATYLTELGLTYVTEHRFHPTRHWRFDFAVPELKLAIEIEGGIHQQGRHVRGKGYQSDLHKYNSATELGWHLIRFSTQDVLRGDSKNTLREHLERLR